MSAYERRADRGRAAMVAGTADYEQNDAATNAVDVIANVLLALHRELGGEPSMRERVVDAALRHADDEISEERAAILEYAEQGDETA